MEIIQVAIDDYSNLIDKVEIAQKTDRFSGIVMNRGAPNLKFAGRGTFPIPIPLHWQVTFFCLPCLPLYIDVIIFTFLGFSTNKAACFANYQLRILCTGSCIYIEEKQQNHQMDSRLENFEVLFCESLA